MKNVILASAFLSLVATGCKKNAPTGTMPDSKPVVAIISPANNAFVYDSTTIEIAATDDKGIVKVELLIDSTIVQTFTGKPYYYRWNNLALPESSIHIISAKAYDADSNIVASSNVIVTVRRGEPNDLRVISLTPAKVILRWKDNCQVESEYRVEGSDDSVGTFTILKVLPANSDSSTVYVSFQPGKKYYFRIVAKITDALLISEPAARECRITFEKRISPAPSGIGFSVQQTSDHGYIISGSSLVKTDEFGNVSWKQNNVDGRGAVLQTDDGGYLFTGPYFVIYKTDQSGNIVWTKMLGNSNSNAWSIVASNDGKYVVAGTIESQQGTSRDVALVKIDGSGSTIWQKTYGGAEWDQGYTVELTSDGGYIVSGVTRIVSSAPQWAYLIKTDEKGDTLWQRQINSGHDYTGMRLDKTSDGYIVCGQRDENQGVLMKVDKNGALLWEKVCIEGTQSLFRCVQQTLDNGFIITGWIVSQVTKDVDLLLLKTDANGNTEWIKTFGGENMDSGNQVRLTNDGGYIITGSSIPAGSAMEDMYLIKTDSDGNVDP